MKCPHDEHELRKERRPPATRTTFLLQPTSAWNCAYAQLRLRAANPLKVRHRYSLRSASTGSFLLALRAGKRPATNVSTTLINTRITAAFAGSCATAG